VRLKIFDYAVLKHPSRDSEGKDKEGEKTELLDEGRELAANEKTLGMRLFRKLKDEDAEDPDRIEILVRPF
jgi:hypothetical protein